MNADKSDDDFREFFAGVGPSLRRTAYLIVRDWHLAEDLTQQSLANVYARWRHIRPQARVAYARRAVVNECLSFLRRKRPEIPVDVVPDQHSLTADEQLDLSALLAQLPEQQRAVVALRFIDDLSVAETALILDIAPGTVKSQTSRAMATLKSHLSLHPAEDSR